MKISRKGVDLERLVDLNDFEELIITCRRVCNTQKHVDKVIELLFDGHIVLVESSPQVSKSYKQSSRILMRRIIRRLAEEYNILSTGNRDAVKYLLSNNKSCIELVNWINY